MTRHVVAEVVSRLAANDGVEPTELEYSLSEHIDPEILEAVVSNGSENCTLTFRVPGYVVTVTGASEITIREPEPRTHDDARSLLSDFADLVFLIDEDGVYRDVLLKPGSSDLLFEQPNELIDSSVHEILPSEVAALTERTITECLRSGEERSIRVELDVPAGTREFEARMLPLKPIRSQPAALVVVSDVTDERVGDRGVTATVGERGS